MDKYMLYIRKDAVLVVGQSRGVVQMTMPTMCWFAGSIGVVGDRTTYYQQAIDTQDSTPPSPSS